MSKTIAQTVTAVANEVDAAIEAARAADPDFDRRVDVFLGEHDDRQLRVVIDLKPSMAFRVELLRKRGNEVKGLVLSEQTPSQGNASPSARTH